MAKVTGVEKDDFGAMFSEFLLVPAADEQPASRPSGEAVPGVRPQNRTAGFAEGGHSGTPQKVITTRNL